MPASGLALGARPCRRPSLIQARHSARSPSWSAVWPCSWDVGGRDTVANKGGLDAALQGVVARAAPASWNGRAQEDGVRYEAPNGGGLLVIRERGRALPSKRNMGVCVAHHGSASVQRRRALMRTNEIRGARHVAGISAHPRRRNWNTWRDA